MSDNHPYKPYIPKDASKLIIGTIPPHRFCDSNSKLNDDDVNFYYGSNDNEFWHLLSQVWANNFSYNNSQLAIDERKDALNHHCIGITDIINNCDRIKESASDKDLSINKLKDLYSLLLENININTLIYTSSFVLSLVFKQINDHYKTYHHQKNKCDKRLKSLNIYNKEYIVHILYSPSPQALRGMKNDGKNIRLEQYRKVFG